MAIIEAADELKEIAMEYQLARRLCTPRYPDRAMILAKDAADPILRRITTDLNRQRDEIDRAVNGLESTSAAVRSEIDRDWVQRKLELVPGDALLENVFRRFGFRFRKQRDSVKIASHMQERDIDSEIRNLLRQIVD